MAGCPNLILILTSHRDTGWKVEVSIIKRKKIREDRDKDVRNSLELNPVSLRPDWPAQS